MAIEGNKIYFEFDPFELAGVPRPKSNVREAKQRLAELVREEVLNHVGQSKSPVAGEGWKSSLSPSYKKQKGKYSSVLKANMELHGDLLDNLDCVINRNGNLELRNTGSQAAKSDGHNNHSGDSSLPQRRFIPDAEQTFRREIIAKMRIVAEEYLDGTEDEDVEDEDE